MQGIRVALLVATVFFTTAPVFSQTLSGVISGSVGDPTGLPISGAAVTLTSDAMGSQREVKSDANGEFIFSSVLPGRYTLVAQMKGFKRLEKTNLNITQAERLSAGNLKLEVGTVNESVTVSAWGTAVDVENTNRSSLLTSDQMEGLQSRGRNYLALLNTMPGAVRDERSFESDAMQSTLTPNFSGIPNTYNTVLVDGGSASSPVNPSYSTTQVSMDSILEVSVSSGTYRAEDGGNGGAVIKAIVKSGTRQFHGTLYNYQRNEALNANFFFNNLNNVKRPRYRYNQFGGTIGGPVTLGKLFNKNREKLFFFASSDTGPRTSPGNLVQVTTPTALERSGDFSQTLNAAGNKVSLLDPLNNKTPFPNNLIPQNRIDPAGQALLNLFPMPNFTNRAISGGQYNYNFLESQNHLTNTETVKIDYNVTSKFRTFISGTIWRQDDKTYGSAGQSWNEFRIHYIERMHNAALHGSYTISPTLVYEYVVSAKGTPNWYTAAQPLTSVQRSALGVPLPQFYPQNNTNNVLPTMSFGGVPGAASFGGGNLLNLNLSESEPYVSSSQSITKIAGAHTIKAGFDASRTRYIGPSSGNLAGSLAFASDTNNPLDTNYAYSNALTGTFQSYAETDTRPGYDLRGITLEWYLQDTWKATRRLTLDVGMRFTWFTPWRQANNKSLNFVPSLYSPSQAVVLYQPVLNANKVRVAQNPLTGALLPALYIGAIVPGSGNPLNGTISQSTAGVPGGFIQNAGILPGPRLGFAYDLTGDGKTAIRGGFGTSYNLRPSAATYAEAAVGNTQNAFTTYYGTLGSLGSVSGVLFPRSLTATNPTQKTPTIYNFSFGVERLLGFGTVLDVAYVGNLARQVQLRDTNFDAVPFGAEFLPQAKDPSNNGTLSDNFFRPYMGYSAIAMPFPVQSHYNGLQTSVNRRFAKGLQIGGHWTWSKSMGYYEPYANYYNNAMNYGKTNIDHTHYVSLNYLWDLPRPSRLLDAKLVKWVFDGWQTSSMISLSSGRPWTVTYSMTSGPNITGGGDYNRVLVVGDPRLPHGDRTFYKFFNTTVFAAPPQILGSVRPGNAPMDVAHGPGTVNVDQTLSKHFRLGERKDFQLRWECYNILNHPSFYQMNVAAQFNAATLQQVNALFGRETNTLTPRVMQISLRFMF